MNKIMLGIYNPEARFSLVSGLEDTVSPKISGNLNFANHKEVCPVDLRPCALRPNTSPS